MKRKLFYLLFLTLPLNLISQNKKQVSFNQLVKANKELTKSTDSLKNKIRALTQKIDIVTKDNFTVKNFNESLEKDLLYFKSKEDYYATALSEQTTRFSWIMASILTLFGLLSFGLFEQRIRSYAKRSKKSIEKQNTKFNNRFNKVNRIEKDLFLAMANGYMSIGYSFQNNNDYSECIKYYIHGVELFLDRELALPNSQNTDYEKIDKKDTIISNLDIIINLLKKLKKEDNEREKFLECEKTYISSLNRMNIKNLDNISCKVSEIRVLINSYSKYIKRGEL